MIERAMTAPVPFRWVVGDTVYGVSAIEMALRRASKGYVLGVSADHQFHAGVSKLPVSGTAAAMAQGLAPSAWRRLSAARGAKGHGYMTGRISNWPTAKRQSLIVRAAVCGPAAC
jgi:SRSO17 transposase